MTTSLTVAQVPFMTWWGTARKKSTLMSILYESFYRADSGNMVFVESQPFAAPERSPGYWHGSSSTLPVSPTP
jgi:hypothetical protein